MTKGNELPALRGERRQQVAADLTDRLTSEEVTILDLAAEVNRRPCTVRRLLVEAGVEDYGTLCLGPSDDAIAAALAGRYRAGASIETLGRETGIDRRVVRRLLLRAGVALPERHAPPLDQAGSVIARYEAGVSIRGLAAETGSSYGVIRRLLLARGVILRASGGTTATGGRR